MDMENMTALSRARSRLIDAQKEYPVGSLIKHVNSGGYYIVAGHAIREINLEVDLLYTKPAGPVWSRPLKEVEEIIDWWDQDEPQGPRFVRIPVIDE